jgi:hypothetical protein
MRLGFDDEDENYEVLVSWLVVDSIVSMMSQFEFEFIPCEMVGSGRSGLYWPFSTVKVAAIN